MDNIVLIEEKLLEKAPPAQAVSRLMALPAAVRLEILLNRQDCAELTAAFPEQDFYLFVKEVGEDNAPSLLALASMDQLNHIVDIEGWNRDSINPGGMLAWCATVFDASERQFVHWLYQADFELLTLLFKEWYEVQQVPEGREFDDVRDQLPALSFDNQFFYEFRYPQYKEFLQYVLTYLFENHHGFYLQLMMHVLWSTKTEIEQLAYRFHKGRLEDLAIPDYEEARIIYYPIRRNTLGRRNIRFGAAIDTGGNLPVFALLHTDSSRLLAAAVKVCEPDFFPVFQQEMVNLVNKIIVVDELSPEIPENIHLAADKASAWINLGLEEMAADDVAGAASCLQEYLLDDIFRLGCSLLRTTIEPLRRLAEEGWLASLPGGFNHLDHGWYEQVTLLLAKTPMLRDEDPEHGMAVKEDLIRTRLGLDRAGTVTAVLAAVGTVIEQGSFGALKKFDELGNVLWSGGQIHTLEDVTPGSLLCTAAIRLLWQGEWSFEPLPVSGWEQIAPFAAAADIAAAVREYVSRKHPPAILEKIMAYLEPVLAKHADETAGLDKKTIPAPKLLGAVLFTDILLTP